MTIQTTPRRGYRQPVPGTGEKVHVSDLNFNSSLSDFGDGAIIVEDGVTPDPSQLWDGALVKERTSGIVWVAQRNVLGNYDKSYVRYPYMWKAFTPGTVVNMAPDNVWQTYGFNTPDLGGMVNASFADTDGPDRGWRCPLSGLYSIHAWYVFGQNGTGGTRSMIAVVNGVGQLNNIETCVPINTADITVLSVSVQRNVSKLETWDFQFKQAGNTGPAALYAHIEISLLTVTGLG